MFGNCGEAVIFDTTSVTELAYWFGDGGWVKAIKDSEDTAGTLCQASERRLVGGGQDTKHSIFNKNT